jgi:hypothetical protein
MDPPDSAGSWRDVVRRHWEVVAAFAILLGVLATIDAGFLKRPALLLSLAPLAFMLVAALVPLTTRIVSIWLLAFAALGLLTRDTTLIGLGYPALIVLVLMSFQRRRQGST